MILRKVGCFIVTAVANGIIFAEHDSMELFAVYHGQDSESFSDWLTETEYHTERFDAEWEFCSRAFEWFQDNVTVEFNESCDGECIKAAKEALDSASEILTEMASEADKLQKRDTFIKDLNSMIDKINEKANNTQENAPQGEATEHSTNSIDEMFRIIINNANNRNQNKS